MAGAGYKLFNTGDVLTAAQVNTYLMEQTVMVFADAAARTTALTGVVSEGMISYLKDTNAVEVYNGSAWVASDDPNAIQNTIVDAKGDLITATAADTPARLAVGNNGETLVADSSTTTGLRWNPSSSAGKNAIINSAFDIWQRGTSIANDATYTKYAADRFGVFRAGLVTGATVSRQTTSDTTNLPEIQYAGRWQRDSGNTSTQDIYALYSLESADSTRFAGKTVTFSFYARRGANYSSSANGLNYRVQSGTGTDQNLGNGFTGQQNVFGTQVATLSTTWQRFSFSGTVASSATQLGFYIWYTPSGTAGANDWFEITGVQLELGNTATVYSRNSGTLAGELDACQRYLPAINTGTAGDFGSGFAYSTSAALITIPFKVQPRIAPTGITISAASDFAPRKSDGVVSSDCTGVTFSSASLTNGTITLTGSAFLTAGNGTTGYMKSTGLLLFTGCEL